MRVFIIIQLIALSLTITAADEIIIVRSNAETKLEEHAIATIFSLLETETNNNNLGRKLIAEMNAKFGNSWSTLIGTNTSTSVSLIDQNANTEITLTYKALTITLFRSLTTTTTTTTANSTALRAHVLNQISRARNSKYVIKNWNNISAEDRESNVTNIVKIFTALTEHFENHTCLSKTESQIEDEQYLNCYTEIGLELRQAIGVRHLVTTGETTSYYTAFRSYPDIGFEFTIGPLYFGVYKY